MNVQRVDFAAFKRKHISVVDASMSSSDVMTSAVSRSTGRAAMWSKNAKNSDDVKLFSNAQINENKNKYSSATLQNTLIILTSGSLAAWGQDILDKAKASGSAEFNVTSQIPSAALLTLGLDKVKVGTTEVNDKQATYANNLQLKGGYGVKVTVLVKVANGTATVVHLDSAESFTHTIPPDQLQKQEAIFTERFLNGLGSL